MYKQNKISQTAIRVNKSYEGESIEKKVERILNNKEPIKDGAPLIYTDRSSGVGAEYNVRTDRWEVAVDAMDKVSKAKVAKREERAKSIGEKAQEGMKAEGEKSQSNDATGGKTS